MTLAAEDAPRRISIAIVDDEPLVRASLRRLCDALGMEATAYASGRAFLEAVDTDACPDCMLLDTQMPGMTGLDIHLELMRRGARIPVVVVTADDAPEARARYLNAGVDEYLRKPIGSDELLAAIERVVHRSPRNRR